VRSCEGTEIKPQQTTTKESEKMKLTRMITLGLALIGAMSVQPIKAADKVPGVGVQPDTYFYTGKPYDADLGSYIFAYRDYNPQLNRWTTADPSGFPDGVNNRIYAPVPTVQVDPTGEVVASKSLGLA
jgi:RHS repeat-associated protein